MWGCAFGAGFEPSSSPATNGSHCPSHLPSVVADRERGEHRHSERIRRTRVLDRLAHVRRSGALGEHDAIGHTSGERERLRPSDTGEHGRRIVRGSVEGDVVHGEHRPVEGHRLTVEESTHDRDRLVEGGER